jgi:hypothetical protein
MFKKLLSLIFILTFGALLFLWFNRVPLASDFLSKRLGLDVHLEDVSLGWNTITVKGLALEDPTLQVKFHADKILIEASPSDLMANPAHIRKIKLNTVKLKSDIGNVKGIAKATKLFEKFTKTSEPKRKVKAPGKHIEIDLLLATDVSLSMTNPLGLGSVNLTVPKVEIKEITTDLNQAIDTLLEQLLKEAKN